MPQSSPLQAVFQRRVVCRESLGSRVSPSIGSTSYNSGGAIRFSESRRTKKRRRCCTKEGIGAPRQVRTADLRFQVCVAFATPWTLSSPCPDALARSGRQADCRRVSTHAHPACAGLLGSAFARRKMRQGIHRIWLSPSDGFPRRSPVSSRKPLLCPTELPGPNFRDATASPCP